MKMIHNAGEIRRGIQDDCPGLGEFPSVQSSYSHEMTDPENSERNHAANKKDPIQSGYYPIGPDLFIYDLLSYYFTNISSALTILTFSASIIRGA